MDIISRINELMEQRGWTPYQLAKYSGLSHSTIANIYRRNTIPSVPTLENICKAFHISLAQFFTEDGEEFYPLDKKQQEFMDFYIQLEEDKQHVVMNVAKNLKPNK